MPTPLLMLLTAAAYGASTALVAAALGHVPPWTLAALRAVLVLPFLLLLAGAAGRQKRPDRHDLVTMLVGGTLVVSVPFVTLAAGLQHIPSGLGGMLLATMPLFTLALAPMFQRDEPPHFDQGLRMGAGVFGVALMAIPGLLGLGFAQAGLGILLTLLAPLSYAAGNIWFRRRRRVAPLMLAAGIFAVGAGTLWPMALLIEGPVRIADPGAAFALLGGLALGGTLAPLLLNFVLLERGALREAGLALMLMPLFSLGFGAWFLGESLSLLGLAGLAVVIAGTSWKVSGGRRSRAALPAEVQGLMRSTLQRAAAAMEVGPAATPAAPEPAPVKLSAEERAARRAERRAERQKAQGGEEAVASAPAPAPAAEAAPAEVVKLTPEERAARRAERRAERQKAQEPAEPVAGQEIGPSALPDSPSDAPSAEVVRLTPEDRAARRAERRAERQKAQGGEAVAEPAGDEAPEPQDAELPEPDAAGENPGEGPGPRAQRQAARRAARQAARQAGKGALQDN